MEATVTTIVPPQRNLATRMTIITIRTIAMRTYLQSMSHPSSGSSVAGSFTVTLKVVVSTCQSYSAVTVTV